MTNLFKGERLYTEAEVDRAKREARVEMFEQIWAAIERLHVEATAVDALNAIAPIIRALIEAERGKP